MEWYVELIKISFFSTQLRVLIIKTKNLIDR